MMETTGIVAGLTRRAERLLEVRAQAHLVATIAARYAAVLRAGGKLLFAGNGGSAADAQHLAAEYVVRLREDRPAFSALALTTDSSILTATGNDLGFAEVFARQVTAIGRPGDLLVIHSISGRSPNLLAAAKAARAAGIDVVAMVGRAETPLAALATLALVVDEEDGAVVQEVQMAVEHLIAAEVERLLGVEG